MMPKLQMEGSEPVTNKVLRSLLLEELKSADPEVNEGAAYCVGVLGGDALDEVMLELPFYSTFRDLDITDSTQQETLKEIVWDLEALESDNDITRYRSAFRLGSLGSPLAIPFLLKTTQSDPSPPARGIKMWALWRISRITRDDGDNSP
jgi:hypothetical protein